MMKINYIIILNLWGKCFTNTQMVQIIQKQNMNIEKEKEKAERLAKEQEKVIKEQISKLKELDKFTN